MRATFAVLVALPLCARAADPKPDFTLTAEAYAKESKTNGKAFREKYKNKVVELTGAVWRPRVPSGDVMLYGFKENPKDTLGTLVFVAPPKSKLEPRHLALAAGQAVTVRGKQVDGAYPRLTDCEFVKVGPSTAHPVTVASLAAEFRKDAGAAQRKYEDRPVVLRAKVVTTKTENNVVRWTLADPAWKGDVTIAAKADPLFGQPLKELEQVKVGDEIVVIGEVHEAAGTPCGFTFLLVLKEPPAGVKLPGDKK